MTEGTVTSPRGDFVQSALETVIRVGVVLLLAAWCFDIIKPFVGVLAWGIIIAIAVSPLYERLQHALGERRVLASVLFTLAMMMLLIAPSSALVETLVAGSQQLAGQLSDGNISVPSPPDTIAEWPLIGKPLEEFWTLASENLREAATQLKPQIKAFSVWLLGAAAHAGFALLTFFVAIIIAGVLLTNAEKGQRAAELVFRRIAGELGMEYLGMSRSTIRSVAQGILGVALIQTLFAGLGFLVAGIPAAGVLAVIVLFLCIVQLGPVLILLPTVIYMFASAEPLAAGVYLVWAIFVALIDNVLKPLLLGRGVDVPVLVVFMGAIGGFLSMGIIGLFVGSVMLVLGYTLLIAWLNDPEHTGVHAAEPVADNPD